MVSAVSVRAELRGSGLHPKLACHETDVHRNFDRGGDYALLSASLMSYFFAAFLAILSTLNLLAPRLFKPKVTDDFPGQINQTCSSPSPICRPLIRS